MDDNSLAHYGIKGMRWGVRKRTPLQRSARRVIKAANVVYNSVSRLDYKG